MNRRTLLILAGIFLALLGLTFAQNYVANQVTPTPPIVLLRIFPEMAVLDIQAIQIRNVDGSRSFTISRAEDGTWTAPDTQGTLNSDAASNIARSVVLLPYQRTVPEVENLTEYGFENDGILLIQVLLANGEQHVVAVGGLTPTGTSYYTLVDERAEVYLVERGAIDFLTNYLLTPPVYLTTPTPHDNLNSDGG
jgi:Domain of unknown function (DUF4340)